MNDRNTQRMLHIPEQTEPWRCPSAAFGASHHGDMEPMSRKRASSFKKQTDRGPDRLYDEAVRPRTSSMPTRNTFRKPNMQHIKHSYLGLNIEPESERYTVRTFEMNSKGVIVRRSDSLRSRSTTSVISSEGDACPVSTSSSRESVTQHSPASVAPVPSRVIVLGAPGCGKTALTQQFMTSEYLGGFNTSIDGDTEKTVNILLNGEETSLTFVEKTSYDTQYDGSCTLHEHEVTEVNETTFAYLVVYACDDRASFDHAALLVRHLRHRQDRQQTIIFIGNKSDLVRSRCVTHDEAKAVAVTYGCKFIETSVVLNINIDELLVGIVKQLRLRCAESLTMEGNKSPGCVSTGKSLLNKLFHKKDDVSKSCENLNT